MAQFNSLPNELLYAVVEILFHQNDLPALFFLSCIRRRFYRIANRYLYRDVRHVNALKTLSLNKSERLILQNIDIHHPASFVRSLAVLPIETPSKEQIGTVTNFLRVGIENVTNFSLEFVGLRDLSLDLEDMFFLDCLQGLSIRSNMNLVRLRIWGKCFEHEVQQCVEIFDSLLALSVEKLQFQFLVVGNDGQVIDSTCFYPFFLQPISRSCTTLAKFRVELHRPSYLSLENLGWALGQMHLPYLRKLQIYSGDPDYSIRRHAPRLNLDKFLQRHRGLEHLILDCCNIYLDSPTFPVLAVPIALQHFEGRLNDCQALSNANHHITSLTVYLTEYLTAIVECHRSPLLGIVLGSLGPNLRTLKFIDPRLRYHLLAQTQVFWNRFGLVAKVYEEQIIPHCTNLEKLDSHIAWGAFDSAPSIVLIVVQGLPLLQSWDLHLYIPVSVLGSASWREDVDFDNLHFRLRLWECNLESYNQAMRIESQSAKAHREAYKTRGTFNEDGLRRRREEQQVEIRQQKREEAIVKRRNILPHTGANSDEDSVSLDDGMISGLFSRSPQQQLVATTKFRKILSTERSPPIEFVIQCGAVPRFVEFLKTGDSALQFEAAWVLTNIAFGATEYTEVVISVQAIPELIKLLSSSRVLDVQEQAAWALGNIAGDGSSSRDHVLQQGALQPLLTLLSESHELSLLRIGTWALSNFCRGSSDWTMLSSGLTVLTKLIYSLDNEILTNTCWAISCLLRDSKDRIQAVIETSVCGHLVELLTHTSTSVQIPALHSVGNIVTGDNSQTQVIIASGALPALRSLLSSANDGIQKVACWTISNITAGSAFEIQAVIDANIITSFTNILQNANFNTRKEGCIKSLCDLLTMMDLEGIQVALAGLDNILKVSEMDKVAAGQGAVNQYVSDVAEAGGIVAIHSLQQHDNPEIYSKALSLMDEYFTDDEELEIQFAIAVPGVDSSGQFTLLLIEWHGEGTEFTPSPVPIEESDRSHFEGESSLANNKIYASIPRFTNLEESEHRKTVSDKKERCSDMMQKARILIHWSERNPGDWTVREDAWKFIVARRLLTYSKETNVRSVLVWSAFKIYTENSRSSVLSFTVQKSKIQIIIGPRQNGLAKFELYTEDRLTIDAPFAVSSDPGSVGGTTLSASSSSAVLTVLVYSLTGKTSVTMMALFIDAYVRFLIQTYHRCEVAAMGDMAFQIPIKDDPNSTMLLWKMHDKTNFIAMDVFNVHILGLNQYHVRRKVVIADFCNPSSLRDS
ncbi:hypothetical protein GYMLUDRAFT_244073 [Collybiopsis luxurians FD-317 M1]|uniref:IBB domain-containing protein n=1 Tax=Collybiopsis luxurians FD-317 M1 TaxID=944289 RepID=A0A0D0CEH1_9AGAR|nr:hypothetical protein GYMLUDRAFT_244073 [Collybiopsis luxurians FD-317 M1]